MKKIFIPIVLALVVGTYLAFDKKDDGILVIGTEGAYMPWNGVDANGEVIGFEKEFGEAICLKIKKQCKFITQNWDGLIPALLNKKFDVIMAGMTITPERLKKLDFSVGYADTGVSFATMKNDIPEIENYTDMAKLYKGLNVGVQKGTVAAFVAKGLLSEVANLREYNTQEEINIDLESSRIDLAFQDTSAWIALQSKNPKLKVISPSYTAVDDDVFGEGVGVAFRKGSDELREEINAAIEELRAEGVARNIAVKHFGYDASL